MHSFSVNRFSFLHQLTNELADDTVAVYTTHTIHTYNIIIIHAFLLMIEMQMCGRVIFPVTENDFFDFNSATSGALGHNSLLSHSLPLSYLALQYQPHTVFASMRT